jgi:putative ABC transport system permease protein
VGVLRDKVWYDLWENKGRTIQVVLIIAMGAFAIGMIIGTRNFIIQGMQESWRISAPAMISLWNDPAIDDDTLAALGRVDGVTEIEGLLQTSIEWRLSPDDPWRAAGLTARDDYVNQRFAVVTVESGDWPHDKDLAVGQGTDTVYGIEMGAVVEIRVDRQVHDATVGGVLYHPNVQPPTFGGLAQFYTTRERFAELTGEENFNRIHARAARYEPDTVTAIADEMQERLEKMDVSSGGFSPSGGRTSNPDKHFFQDAMDGIFFILGLLALLALVLGLFLVYSTVTSIVERQTDQIGILKAVGASSRQVFMLYFAIVLAYGLLALLVVLPLGALGAQVLGTFLLDTFDAQGTFALSPLAVVAQVIIALITPLLAALGPISTAANISVREAISNYGLQAEPSALDRLLAHFRRLPQLFSLTVSNTFRHKRRVLLTQVTLVLSGIIFMTVMSARDATLHTFQEVVFSILRFDVNLTLQDGERIDRIERLTLSQPGVSAVELWQLSGGTLRPVDRPESNDDEGVTLFGVPLPTELYRPQLQAGRWLNPEDTYAIVLNQKLADEVGVGIGDTVTFSTRLSEESDWQVVGLLFDPVVTNSAHVPRAMLLTELAAPNRANTVWIQTDSSDPATEEAVARALRDLYADQKVDLSATSVFGQDTAAEIIDSVMSQFNVIITLLATMAVVIGVVGSIALAGVLSLNVIERRREIGVLRAIGATSRVVSGLFVGEALLLGWLSWLIALPLSLPAGRLMVEGLSAAVDLNLVYIYRPAGALAWLVIITLLAVGASWLPARAASRISVRESLVYE